MQENKSQEDSYTRPFKELTVQRVLLYYDIKHLFTMLSPGNINFCISSFVFTALTWFAELLPLTQVQNVRTTLVLTMCSLLHNQKIWMN